MRAVPRSARVKRARIEISVVLPAPFGPSKPKNSPSRTVNSTPASACTSPKRRATSATSTAAGTKELADDEFLDAVNNRQRMQRGRQRHERQMTALGRRTALDRDQDRERRGVRLRQAREIDDARRRQRQRLQDLQRLRRIVHCQSAL